MPTFLYRIFPVEFPAKKQQQKTLYDIYIFNSAKSHTSTTNPKHKSISVTELNGLTYTRHH